MFKKMFVQKRREQVKDYEKQEKRIKELKAHGKSAKVAEKKTKDALTRKQEKGRSGKTAKAEDEDGPQELLARPKEYIVKFRFPDPSPLQPPILGLHSKSERLFSYSLIWIQVTWEKLQRYLIHIHRMTANDLVWYKKMFVFFQMSLSISPASQTYSSRPNSVLTLAVALPSSDQMVLANRPSLSCWLANWSPIKETSEKIIDW